MKAFIRLTILFIFFYFLFLARGYTQYSKLETTLGKFNFSVNQYFEVDQFDFAITIYTILENYPIALEMDSLRQNADTIALQVKSILEENFNSYKLKILFRTQYEFTGEDIFGWEYSLDNFSGKPDSMLNIPVGELTEPLSDERVVKICEYPLNPNQYLIAVMVDNSIQVRIYTVTRNLDFFRLSDFEVSEAIASYFYKKVFYDDANIPVRIDAITKGTNFAGKEIKHSFTFKKRKSVSLDQKFDISELLLKYPLQKNQFFEIEPSDTPTLSLNIVVDHPESLFTDSNFSTAREQIQKLFAFEPNILPLTFMYLNIRYYGSHMGESGPQLMYIFRPADAINKEFFAKKTFPPRYPYDSLKKYNPSLFRRIQHLTLKANQFVGYTSALKKITLVSLIDGDPSYLIGVAETESQRMAVKLQLELEPDPKREIDKFDIIYRSQNSRAPVVCFRFIYKNGEMINAEPRREREDYW